MDALQALSALRGEVEALRRHTDDRGGLSGLLDQGQRRMATRVLQVIDRQMEQLDREGCESSDGIAEELRA